jgi:hypothetical protein
MYHDFKKERRIIIIIIIIRNGAKTIKLIFADSLLSLQH